MNLQRFVSTCFMLLIITSFSFAQDDPMNKNMMKDSTDSMMMDKDKMMKDKEMMNDDMTDGEMMKVNTNMDGVAIKGYDPVSYFEDGKPMMGSENHSYKWMGATWYFTNGHHMKIFKEDPYKYAPKYGGYCAFAASEGYYAPADPEVWTVHKGKLYLNYNSDVTMMFEENIDDRIMKADENWKGNKLKEQK